MLSQPTCQKVSLITKFFKLIFWVFIFSLNPFKERSITNLTFEALQNLLFSNRFLFQSKFWHIHQFFFIFGPFSLMNSPIVISMLLFFHIKWTIKWLVIELFDIFDPVLNNFLSSIMFLCNILNLHISCVVQVFASAQPPHSVVDILLDLLFLFERSYTLLLFESI